MIRRALAGLAAVVAVLVTGVAPVPAHAAPAGCTGVWVVVDPGPLGGEPTTACAPAHATGTEALASAGFEIARGSGMLCRIDGLPERCEVTAAAYWSYWQASPEGGSYGPWTYASLGPDSTRPAGGAVEGWVFGDGSEPPSVVPTEVAVAGSPTVAASPAASSGPTPSPQDAGDLSGPFGVAAVAGGLLVAAGAVWLARRRTG